ncbi:MAG TPA: prephenate dehydrogenase dimerization domain-containing protein, partial [Longimicrobiales bacterium]|nr:prephenate dehydrogenase dimerization domain-containing protein [Longimicrobiales bacterium]
VPELCPPDVHDARVAWISHLPQVVSSALALALADQDIARSELGPGGRGVTRLAGSAADMWTAIALDNGAAIALAIRALEHRLVAARQAIDAGDAEAIRQLFAQAADWAAGLNDPQSPRLTAGATSD